MRYKRYLAGLVFAVFLLFAIPFSVSAGFGDLLKGAQEKFLGGQDELSEGTIIDGLKEALHIGTGNTVGFVSKMDGYYKNPRIKIPLPRVPYKKWKRFSEVSATAQR